MSVAAERRGEMRKREDEMGREVEAEEGGGAGGGKCLDYGPR